MLGRGLGDSDQPDDVEQWGLFDVSTNAQLLNTSQNAQVLIDAFNDLGTGTSYGSYAVKTDVGDPIIAREVLSFPLNAAGLSAINASAGDYFSMGGKLLSITGWNDYSFGGGVPWAGVAKLVLTQVPEPSSLAVGAMAFTCIAVYRRRRA
jgi:hypothetical protein